MRYSDGWVVQHIVVVARDIHIMVYVCAACKAHPAGLRAGVSGG